MPGITRLALLCGALLAVGCEDSGDPAAGGGGAGNSDGNAQVDRMVDASSQRIARKNESQWNRTNLPG